MLVMDYGRRKIRKQQKKNLEKLSDMMDSGQVTYKSSIPKGLTAEEEIKLFIEELRKEDNSKEYDSRLAELVGGFCGHCSNFCQDADCNVTYDEIEKLADSIPHTKESMAELAEKVLDLMKFKNYHDVMLYSDVVFTISNDVLGL